MVRLDALDDLGRNVLDRPAVSIIGLRHLQVRGARVRVADHEVHVHAALVDALSDGAQVLLRPDAAGDGHGARGQRDGQGAQVLEAHLNGLLRARQHGRDRAVRRVRRARVVVELAVAPDAEHGHGVALRGGLRCLPVRRGILVDGPGPPGDADVGLQDRGLEAAAAELARQLRVPLRHVSPHAVDEQVPILSNHALALERHVAHGVPLQIVGVPEVMAAGEEPLAVDGDDLGVVPAQALPPRGDPYLQLGLVAQVLRQLPAEVVVVDRHADDIASDDAHDDVLAALVQSLNGALHGL
mmetsp:Transcript_30199/g.70022  ORF Transcript_30199/g.70022 Transcript_30199/m.70022 type:complete len:298 (+) Transcript_30199:990-1883(+)